MAVVVVEDNATRAEDFEGTPTISGINVGGSGAQELVTFYQGAASGSAKASSGTKDAGFEVVSAATHDVTTAAKQAWIVKYFISDGSDLDADGMKLWAGSSSTAYHQTYVHDDGTAYGLYPPTNSFLILPWFPDMAEWRDSTTGSPTMTAIDTFSITGQWVTGGAKSENVFLDSIDLSNGLWLTRGDSTDPDGTFESFYDDDEGSATTGRFGHVSKPNQLDGVYQVFGTLVIGRTQAGATTNATEFTDANKTLVFPGGRVDTGWNTLEVDITNVSTVIDIASCTFIGTSLRPGTKQRFRTAAGTAGSVPGIDVTPDEIEFDTGATGLVPHGFVTGQPLTYSKEGGTATTGLTDTTVYYAVEGSTSTRLGLATTRINAYAATLIALTATTGEEHSLVGQIITRPRLLCTNGGTPGTVDFRSCSFVGWDQFDLTAGATFTGCNFVGARLVDMSTATNNGGTLSGCAFAAGIHDVGDALIVADTLANIIDCAFTHSVQGGDADGTFNRSGHMIEIDTAGTYAFSGNTFTGSGPDSVGFLTSQAFTSEQITLTAHPYTTGDPVYYHKDGGTAAIGLTDGALYYLRSVDANTVTVHPSWADATENANAENLTTNGTDTHLFYSGFADVVNTSAGAVTINVTGGGSPTVRNVGVSTTTVSASVPVAVTCQEGIVPIQNVQVSLYLSSDNSEILNSDTNASGIASGSFAGSTPAAIYWRARKSSPGDTKYVKQSGLGTITVDGFDLTVTMVVDTNNNA
jgi:hypothetical protein